MENLEYFFTAYFNQAFGFESLDWHIERYKQTEIDIYTEGLIKELYAIIQSQNYELAAKIMSEHGARNFQNQEKTEKFIKYIYNKFLDIPTDVKAEDFNNKYPCIFCPVCTPDEIIDRFSVLGLHEIIEKDIIIYLCKPCKLMWPSNPNNITKDNAQDYKKYMKSLGLKGTWKELHDIDVW